MLDGKLIMLTAGVAYLARLIELLVGAPVIGCLSLSLEHFLLAGCTQVLILLPQAAQNAVVLVRTAQNVSAAPSPPVKHAMDIFALTG